MNYKMEWTESKNKLPDCEGRYLCYCHQRYCDGSSRITVLVQANYDPCIGWTRSENEKRDLYVLYWAQIPQLPDWK